ncbi:hypothetical protein VNI00_001039 [Paramarasmius palmivorus]|uniref:Uncharacterized protein n=1 Tax=Paramarasmius palmivorus TaxID=297713 RepID=A0AAW0E8C5_9AGAR
MEATQREYGQGKNHINDHATNQPTSSVVESEGSRGLVQDPNNSVDNGGQPRSLKTTTPEIQILKRKYMRTITLLVLITAIDISLLFFASAPITDFMQTVTGLRVLLVTSALSALIGIRDLLKLLKENVPVPASIDPSTHRFVAYAWIHLLGVLFPILAGYIVTPEVRRSASHVFLVLLISFSFLVVGW